MKENHYGDDECQLDGGKGHKGNNWRGGNHVTPHFCWWWRISKKNLGKFVKNKQFSFSLFFNFYFIPFWTFLFSVFLNMRGGGHEPFVILVLNSTRQLTPLGVPPINNLLAATCECHYSPFFPTLFVSLISARISTDPVLLLKSYSIFILKPLMWVWTFLSIKF